MNDNKLPALMDMPPGRHEARRANLLDAMDGRPAPHAGRKRLMIGGGAAALLAAGVAAAFVLAPGPARDVGRTPLIQADASQVLTRAALVANDQPVLKPRPGQFLYVESKSRQDAATGQAATVHRKVWLSVDGKHAGLLHNVGEKPIWLCSDPTNSNGEKFDTKVDLGKPPKNCVDTPAVRRNLPTTPEAMLKWLYRNSQGGNPPDVQAFVTVGDTIRESYVPPAALSAMFRAAAKIPGTGVTRNVVDLAGRQGIAVGQTWQGTRQELIFDAKTYQLLGERTVASGDTSFQPTGGSTPKAPGAPQARPIAKDGTVLYAGATLKVGFTDRVEQTP